MSDLVEFVPQGYVYQVLRDAAEARGFNAYKTGSMVVVMCAGCWPGQPEEVRNDKGELLPWRDALRPRSKGVLVSCQWPGLIQIRARLGDSRDVWPVGELVERFEDFGCCHWPEQGLAGWDWRADLVGLIEQAVADDPDADTEEWEERYDDRVSRLERAAEELALKRAVVAASAHLTHRERVKALYRVLKDAGWPVEQAAALVTMECGHTEAGKYASIGWLVEIDGLPGPSHNSCTLPHRNEPEIDLGELLEEYHRVAALPEAERKGYTSPRSRPSKAAAPAKIEGPAAVRWLDGLDLPEDQRPRVPASVGVRAAWELAKVYPAPRPTQETVRVAQAARKGS